METLCMSGKERARLEVFGRVKAGDITLVKASEILGMSYRQVKRSWARYQALGAVGLVHRLRGRSSNRQADQAVKESCTGRSTGTTVPRWRRNAWRRRTGTRCRWRRCGDGFWRRAERIGWLRFGLAPLRRPIQQFHEPLAGDISIRG